MRTSQQTVLLNPFSSFLKSILIMGVALHAAVLSAQLSSTSNSDEESISEPTQTSGPDLVVDVPVFDFGESKDKEIIRHSFVLKNVGDETLVISDIDTSCGCTTTGDFQKELPAGASAALPVSFDPSSFGGDVQKLVIITSNDPEQPETYLRIQGHIWEPVELNPKLLSFKVSASTKELQPKKMRLVNNLPQMLTPQIKKQSSESVKLEIKEVDAGKEFDLVVTPIGPFEKKTEQIVVTISTGLDNPSQVTGQIVFVYQPDIFLFPSSIQLSENDKNDKEYTITILNRKNTTLKITPKPLDIPEAEMRIEEVHQGRLYKLQLKFPDNLSSPDDSNSIGTIQIETNNEDQPLLTIPVME